MNNISEPEQNTLSVFCSDTVGVKARVTFDSCVTQGIQCTFWMDDEDADVEERINSMFDILFEEIFKTMKNEEELKNQINN
jgi:hypothetical protein